MPEKQVKLLIEAYKNLETDKKLVIAGGASHTSDYFNEVKECANGRDDIIFTDFVQGEVLEELYSSTIFSFSRRKRNLFSKSSLSLFLK